MTRVTGEKGKPSLAYVALLLGLALAACAGDGRQPPAAPTPPASAAVSQPPDTPQPEVATDRPLETARPAVTTIAPPPTASPLPTRPPATPTATPRRSQPTPPPTATLAPGRQVNGIPVDMIAILPEPVRQRVRQIYGRGQSLGRNDRAFSRLGDSLIATSHFLTRFDLGPYNLGDYAHLQPVLDHYAGSFRRHGVAIRVGLHAWGVFDPLWANKKPLSGAMPCKT